MADDERAKNDPRKPSAVADRILKAAEATKAAVVGIAHGDSLGSIDKRRAQSLEAESRWPLEPYQVDGTGAGGELRLNMRLEDWQDRELRDTIKRPDCVTATATVERLRQASAAGCLDTALDTADTIKPRNNLERMLAHQMAAAHNSAMRMTGLAMVHTHNAEHRCGSAESFVRCQQHGIEAARLANAAARMMAAFNEGMLTLAKIRTGGRQTVVVQHIDNRGGRAVVAGQLKQARRRARGSTLATRLPRLSVLRPGTTTAASSGRTRVRSRAPCGARSCLTQAWRLANSRRSAATATSRLGLPRR